MQYFQYIIIKKNEKKDVNKKEKKELYRKQV